MRSLVKPTQDACSTFKLCTNNIQDGDFRDKLKSVEADIKTAETLYTQEGANGSLFAIAEEETIAGRVNVKEMQKLYKDTFARNGSPTRVIYDSLKAAPRNGICPLCGHRIVSTLDHYLASSRHPALAVTPLNLIPACSDCNKVKLDRQPADAQDQTLHPYFDDFDCETWLIASVIEEVAPVVRFSVNPPADWNALKKARVGTHFLIFKLALLYTTHAAEELLHIRLNLERLTQCGGANALRNWLAEQAESRQAVSRNTWQGAMYTALAGSDWFCANGYREIPR